MGRRLDLEIKLALEEYGQSQLRKPRGRFSGKHYKNSQEKLEAIRQKYADGVTSEHLQELYEKIGGQERIF